LSAECRFYFCKNCFYSSQELEEFYFVQDESPNSFCSEECIEEFFRPLMDHFKDEDKKARVKFKLVNEPCLVLARDQKFLEQVFSSPDKTWIHQNDLGESYYILIKELEHKKHGKFWMLSVCFMYKQAPSFIFLSTATKDERLISEWKPARKKDHDSKVISKEIGIDQDTLQELELKKSHFLALILEQRGAADIPIEEYLYYDEFLAPTLEAPDEIFSENDKNGDVIYKYFRSFEKGGLTFYYVLICVNLGEISQGGDDAAHDTLFPLLSFPTKDPDLYQYFRSGQLLIGTLKN